jgi:hypothetical protein
MDITMIRGQSRKTMEKTNFLHESSWNKLHKAKKLKQIREEEMVRVRREGRGGEGVILIPNSKHFC